MSNTISFEILVDKLIRKPLEDYLIRASRFVKPWSVSISEPQGNPDFLIVNIQNITFKTICDFGGIICFSSYNWNRNLENRIKERSEYNRWGKKMFAGTDEERMLLDEQDKGLITDFPDNYFNDFLIKFRKANENSVVSSIVEDSIQFEVMLNFEDSTSGIDHECNELFNTDFKVVEVYLNDCMFFAKIEASKVNLIDIFCLGYMISYNDQRRFEKMRMNSLNKI